MKNIIHIYLLIFSTVFTYAQVGIGTNSPNGALDISSTIYGIVYPSVALLSTVDKLSVTNPNGGNPLVDGTTIYNTNSTMTGTNDVEPGIYSWDSVSHKWLTHFFKRQSELFEQTALLRTSSAGGYVDIPGFPTTPPASVNKFTAEHSGLYKIEVKVNFGGGDVLSTSDVNAAPAEGTFRFIFNGTTTTFTTKSFSIYTTHVSGVTNYSNIWKESYTTIYINLVEGTIYPLSLEFDQSLAPGFVNSGNSGVGMGYIGENIPCFIEFTYIDE